MPVTAEQQRDAGIKLQSLAEEYREINPYLDNRLALKIAIMTHPKTAEKYLGYSVRQDGRDEALRFLVNYRAPQ